MTITPTKQIVMSQSSTGKIAITIVHADELIAEGDSPESLLRMGRYGSDAVATAIVPMTEEAFADFIGRHGGRPLYPTLAAYPYPDHG